MDDRFKEAIREACAEWMEHADTAEDIKAMLLGCEQRLCELIGEPRPATVYIQGAGALWHGNGRECAEYAYRRLKNSGGGRLSSQ